MFEVGAEDRESGLLHKHTYQSGRGGFETVPVCFVSAYPLLAEVEEEQRKGAATVEEGQLRVIARDRECKRWVQWQPFRTPREHYEDEMQARLERDRRWFEWKITAFVALIGLGQIIASLAPMLRPAAPITVQVTMAAPTQPAATAVPTPTAVPTVAPPTG